MEKPKMIDLKTFSDGDLALRFYGEMRALNQLQNTIQMINSNLQAIDAEFQRRGNKKPVTAPAKPPANVTAHKPKKK